VEARVAAPTPSCPLTSLDAAAFALLLLHMHTMLLLGWSCCRAHAT